MFYNMFFYYCYLNKKLLLCNVKIKMKIAQSFYLKKTNTKKQCEKESLRKDSFFFA